MKGALFITLFVFVCLFPVLSFAEKATVLSQEVPEIVVPQNLEDSNIVLTVGGKIAKTAPVVFDLKTLMQFAPVSFSHKNRWTDATHIYSGVELTDLLDFLQIDSDARVIEVEANNDYKSTIGLQDINKYQYILSYKMDNKLYAEHDLKNNKGPLAIAINFDKYPEMDWEIYKHQQVWFVEKITVR